MEVQWLVLSRFEPASCRCGVLHVVPMSEWVLSSYAKTCMGGVTLNGCECECEHLFVSMFDVMNW